MAAFPTQFVLLLYVLGTFGNIVREQLVPGNRGIQAQDHDTNNPLPNRQDLDSDNLRQQWQDFVTFVNRKIDGMELVMAEKEERINQLEVNLASQKTEIKQLKQEALEKDEIIGMLVTKVADLEKDVICSADQDDRLPPENNQNRLYVDKTAESSSGFSPEDMSITQATIAETSNYQNDSVIQNYSGQQTGTEDDNFPYRYGNADTVININKGPKDSSIVKVQRVRQKRVPPLKSTIAFHVALSYSKVVTNDEVVVYDRETMDQGNGYQPHEGLYVVPESGTYVITWTTLCNARDIIQTVLVVNGAVRGSSFTESRGVDELHQTSAVVVLTLNQGDRVFIRTGHVFGHGTIISLNVYALSTFSGWKID